ncbi:MAG: hypothetical protein WBM44_00180, partial [Waterburya sp.]
IVNDNEQRKNKGTFSISQGELTEKSQANDTETVLVKSPKLDDAFWAMSSPKVGIKFFPPTRSVR